MFVVLHPHSQNNPTDKYRVVDSKYLTRFLNGASTSYAFLPYNTYEEAERARDEANRFLMNP